MGGFKDGFWLPIAVVLTGTFTVGVVAGRYSAPSPKNTTNDAVRAMTASVVALEQRVEAMNSSRCLNITTAKLDIGVFPVENLGRVKVTK